MNPTDINKCGHEYRFHIMGAKNGCLACELEDKNERMARQNGTISELQSELSEIKNAFKIIRRLFGIDLGD